MSEVKLFCFPCAGGSASIYYRWRKLLKPNINICPIEFPGRGKRMNDVLYDSIEDAVEECYKILKAEGIGNNDYALYGHSMGSLIAYELANRIQKDGVNPPKHLFVSGKKAPHIPYNGVYYHKLPDDVFKTEIQNLGGIPKLFMESDEIFNLYVPTIRSDCKMVENYTYKNNGNKLECGITAIFGSLDPITEGDNENSWSMHTNSKFCSYSLEVGHFIVFDAIKEVVNIINESI